MERIFLGFCVFGVLAGSVASAPAARRVALARDGKALAAIVLPAAPTVSAQLGAKELQWHVARMTGAELPIVGETALVRDGRARLYIGDTQRARKLGLTQARFRPQEYATVWLADGIVFAGKDADDRRTLSYDAENPAKLANLPGLHDERGSADAVYDFLERNCGVRWLAATTTGSVIPRRETLTVSGSDRRYRASLEMRAVDRVLYAPEICMWRSNLPQQAEYYEAAWPGAGTGGARRNLWLLHSMRWRNGGVPLAANHSLYGYYDRFCGAAWDDRVAKAADEKARAAVLDAKKKVFEGDRPEFFARGYPNDAVPPQLCYTSEALVQQVAQDARDYYDGKKDRRNLAGFHWSLPNPFVIEPMDNSSFCACDTCRSWLSGTQTYKGYSNDRHSNYHFQFVNAVARELKKTHPGKPVITLAYMTHAAPPSRVALEPTVHVQYCFATNRGSFMTGEGTREERRQMDAWVAEAKKSGRGLSLWFYNTFPMETYDNAGSNGFPGFFAREFARQIKRVHAQGFKGIYHCGWGQDVENYVGFRLMYDASLDVERLLDEYFAGVYGAAAAPMKRMYDEMEDAWSNPANRPEKRVGQQELCWRHLGTPERMAAWQKLYDEALAAAGTDRERRNLALFDKAVWSYMKAGFETYGRRMANPMPSAVVPRVADAGGDFGKVDWARAVNPAASWSRQNSAKPSRRALALRMAHDGRYLYLRMTDPCGDTSKLSESHPGDTLEVFAANSRAIPYRQFIVYSGEKKKLQAFMQGEVNWRMNVALTDHHVKHDVRCPDAKTMEMFLAVPLDELTPGGTRLSAGDAFYLNAVRVTPPALTHPEDRVGWGYSTETLSPYCGLHETDRLGEFTLGK